MNNLIESIYAKIKDFRKDEGVQITREGIRDWALQFGDEAEFMLSETDNILGKTYLTKQDAINLLRKYVSEHLVRYKYSNIVDYLKDTLFLRLQPAGKSQQILVDLVEGIIRDDYGLNVSDFYDYPKKLFVYFDDVLITGGTILDDLSDWINQSNRLSEINNHRITLEVDLFVIHRLGQELFKYKLTKFKCKGLNDSCIHVWFYYQVENHLKFVGQSLNAVVIPVKEYLPHEAIMYWDALDAKSHSDYAFRSENNPVNEMYFTSRENRIRFERILVEKGLYIINQIHGVKPNVRPLGFIYPSYKTLGVGTLFFTWRNIPNNSPLVFWWDVPGHNWKPLFPANRGL